ncbi:MAG: CPBP family intramembrane glutamic endopeptidase [Planctomycetota bacterium]
MSETAVRNSKPAAGAGGLRAYFTESKGLAVSLVAIAPLWVLYEIGLRATNANVMNGGEAVLQRVFNIFGEENGRLIWRVVLATVFFAAGVLVIRGGVSVIKTILLIAVEGCLYGALLGPASMMIQKKAESLFMALSPAAALDWNRSIQNISLSLGAGVYEEIVFRLILLSAIYFIIKKSSGSVGSHSAAAAAAAVILSALVFSGYHYWPEGDPFVWKTFLFRAIAGAVLGTIFIFRGLGVAVYTHAAYDVLTVYFYS